MKARAHRLKLVEKLIKERIVCSQEQLQAILINEGFSVTQATLSRDLHTLKAYRAIGDDSSLRYILPEADPYKLDHETKIDIARGCLSVANSGNLIVFRTPSGFASTFAIAFERLALDDILGVIAGHDTVFVALREGTDVTDFYKKIYQKVPDIKIKLD